MALNYDLDLAVGDNETGFKGTGDFYYRREAWAFILAGGALYNNLDYSFTVGCEDGTYAYPSDQPGGGTVALRAQLGILSRFIHCLNFVNMLPGKFSEGLPEGIRVYGLEEIGRQYAWYVCREEREPPEETTTIDLRIDLPPGDYRFEWVNTITGAAYGEDEFTHRGGERILKSPDFLEDIALCVRRET